MLKELSKILLKYFIVFLAILAVFLVTMMLFHLLPLFKLKLSDNQTSVLFKIFLIPSFYHSFFNALIISICLFGVTTLSSQKKYRVIAFFIPLVLSTILVYTLLNYFSLRQKDLTVSQIDDPRLFFSDRTFFEYKNGKYYFNDIERNRINNIVVVADGNVYFYDYANVFFDKNIVRLELVSQNIVSRVDFSRDSFNQYNINNGLINKTFFSLVYNIASNFISAGNSGSKIYLWFCIAFFLLALTITAKIKNYPLLSIIYNLFFLILFYYIFNNVQYTFYKFSQEIIKRQSDREFFFSSALLFFGILIYLVHLLLLKSHNWED